MFRKTTSLACLAVLTLALALPAGAAELVSNKLLEYGRYKLSTGAELRTLPNNEVLKTNPDGSLVWNTNLDQQIANHRAASHTYEKVWDFTPNADAIRLVDPNTLGYPPGKYEITGGDGDGHIFILPNGRYIRWNRTASATVIGADLKAVLARIAGRNLTVKKPAVQPIATSPNAVVSFGTASAPTGSGTGSGTASATSATGTASATATAPGSAQNQEALAAALRQMQQMIRIMQVILQRIMAAVSQIPVPVAITSPVATATVTASDTPATTVSSGTTTPSPALDNQSGSTVPNLNGD